MDGLLGNHSIHQQHEIDASLSVKKKKTYTKRVNFIGRMK